MIQNKVSQFIKTNGQKNLNFKSQKKCFAKIKLVCSTPMICVSTKKRDYNWKILLLSRSALEWHKYLFAFHPLHSWGDKEFNLFSLDKIRRMTLSWKKIGIFSLSFQRLVKLLPYWNHCPLTKGVMNSAAILDIHVNRRLSTSTEEKCSL